MITGKELLKVHLTDINDYVTPGEKKKLLKDPVYDEDDFDELETRSILELASHDSTWLGRYEKTIITALVALGAIDEEVRIALELLEGAEDEVAFDMQDLLKEARSWHKEEIALKEQGYLS